MAGNKEILDFPLLSAPEGSEVYGVKSDTDYRIAVGSALGIATLGADGKLTASQVPAGGSSGTVTSVAVANATGISWTGSPITTSGTLTPTLSANLQAWSGLAPSSKADASHTHALSSLTQSGATSGQVPQWNGSSWVPATVSGGGGSGTVTSVAVANATGITWSGSPITTSGTLTPTLSANLQAWHALATSAKADASHTHAASDITSGTIDPARLGSGTSITTKFLRGDGTWQTISGGGAGTVTSIDGAGGTTGMSFSGGPITSSGTLTLAGTLVVANGGTGATSLTGYVKGSGTSALTASSTIPGSDISGNISGNASNVTGTVAVANGGTGATSLTGYVKGNGTSAMTATATIPVSDGGTGGTSAATGRNGLGIYVQSSDPGAVANDSLWIY